MNEMQERYSQESLFDVNTDPVAAMPVNPDAPGRPAGREYTDPDVLDEAAEALAEKRGISMRLASQIVGASMPLRRPGWATTNEQKVSAAKWATHIREELILRAALRKAGAHPPAIEQIDQPCLF